MKKFIYGFAVGAIVMIIVAFVKTNQLRKEANEKIEITQVLYYTHGFKDGQLEKGGKRLVDTLTLTPERIQLILDNAIIIKYLQIEGLK